MPGLVVFRAFATSKAMYSPARIRRRSSEDVCACAVRAGVCVSDSPCVCVCDFVVRSHQSYQPESRTKTLR